MPARKARLVTDHIRGRSVPEARTVLAFTQRAAAREIEKVLRSAVANAEANHGLVGDDLVVVRAYVDEGPTMKRWRARARGRVARIHKRTCHITIELAEPVAPRRRHGPAEPARRRSTRRRRAHAPARRAAEAEAPKPPVPRTARGAGEPEAEASRGPSPSRAPSRRRTREPEPEAPATEETED